MGVGGLGAALRQPQPSYDPQIAMRLQALSQMSAGVSRSLLSYSLPSQPHPPFDNTIAALGQHSSLRASLPGLQQGFGGAASGLGTAGLSSMSAAQRSLFSDLGSSLGQSHFFAAGQPQTRNMPSQMQGGIARSLPAVLAQPEDSLKLSPHQVLLRHQIEAFKATEDDISTHTRGRNKPITLGQVGIRCRHCAQLPVARRQKGSTYFPATLLGLYQAAQNMSTTHMQCGLCTEMPEAIKQEFAHLLSSKVASSGAGRPYWAESAKRFGLVDTEEGIRFIRDLPPGLRLTES